MQEQNRHYAEIRWPQDGTEYVKVLSTVAGPENALKLARYWVSNHLKGDPTAQVKYLGHGPWV